MDQHQCIEISAGHRWEDQMEPKMENMKIENKSHMSLRVEHMKYR
jgi:hypothetical protein